MARKGFRIHAGWVQCGPGRLAPDVCAERVQSAVAHARDRSTRSPAGGRPTSIAGGGGPSPRVPARSLSCRSSSGVKPSLCLVLSYGVRRPTTIPTLSPRGRWTSTRITLTHGVGLRSRELRSHNRLSETCGAGDSRLGRSAFAGCPCAIHAGRRDSRTAVNLV